MRSNSQALGGISRIHREKGNKGVSETTLVSDGSSGGAFTLKYKV